MSNKPKMKLRKAIEILIDHTRQNIRGSGTGISSVPSYKEREKAEAAIERAEYYIYEWKRES